MVGLLFVTSRANLAIAYPLVFVSTCLFSLFRPALNATLPAVVGDEAKLVQANTIRSQVDGLAFVIGPSLTGILILLGQTRIAFAINAATYLVSAATLLLVQVPPRPKEVRPAEGGWLAETLATLSTMDYFGEIALLRDVPRTATVQSRGPVELYSLSRADFQDLLARSEHLRSAMAETGDTRYEDTQTRLLMRL